MMRRKMMSLHDRLARFALLVTLAALLTMGLLVAWLGVRHLAEFGEEWGEEWDTQRTAALSYAWGADMDVLRTQLWNLEELLCEEGALTLVGAQNEIAVHNRIREPMDSLSDGAVWFVVHVDGNSMSVVKDNRLRQPDSVLAAVVEQAPFVAGRGSACSVAQGAASPMPLVSSRPAADTVWMTRRLTLGTVDVFPVVGQELLALEHLAEAINDDLLLGEGPESRPAFEPWVLRPIGASRGDQDLHRIATIPWLRPELGRTPVLGALSVELTRPSIAVDYPWFASLFLALVASALAFVLARRFAAKIAIPIRKMADTAMIVGLGNPGRNFRYTGRSIELRRMAGSLNRMVARMREDAQLELGLANRQWSHDMNSTVSQIHHAARLLEHIHDADPAKLAEVYTRFREHLRAGIDKMRGMADLLAKDSQRATEDPTDLAEVVRSEVASQQIALQTGYDGVNINISEALGPEPRRVKMDKTSLRRVVQNLMDNAVRALRGRGGSIRIVCEKVILEGASGQRLVIEDDGPGFPEKDGQWPIPDKEGGGLGLPIVCKLLEDVGGGIWFGRGKNGGTRVKVELKAADPRLSVEPAGETEHV